MLSSVPVYVVIIFVVTVLLTLNLFVRSTKNKKTVLYVCLAWLALQAVMASVGFYLNTSTLPPHFVLAVIPVLFAIIVLFATKAGRGFIDKIDLRTITLLSIVRIPVELVLYWLFVNKAVPQLMTFAGRTLILFQVSPLLLFILFVSKEAMSPTKNYCCCGM